MKKLILVVVVLAVMAATGFVTARLQKSRSKFPPHTITYRLTFYDESEKLIGTDILIRRVDADGNWKHTQVRSDGSIQFSNGKLQGLLTSRQPDPDSPEHLKFKYIAERNRAGDVDTWISPDVQDYLLFTTFRPDGSKESEMKAVDISRP